MNFHEKLNSQRGCKQIRAFCSDKYGENYDSAGGKRSPCSKTSWSSKIFDDRSFIIAVREVSNQTHFSEKSPKSSEWKNCFHDEEIRHNKQKSLTYFYLAIVENRFKMEIRAPLWFTFVSRFSLFDLQPSPRRTLFRCQHLFFASPKWQSDSASWIL